MNVSELSPGMQATIVKVKSETLSLKLFEMGVLPGEQVSLAHVAPFGDPIAIHVGEYKLCLRLEDASEIEIVAN
jgi:ferrous iron transport protein A